MSPSGVTGRGLPFSMSAAWFIFLFAFSIWMLSDAVRRNARLHWYFVILFLPLGAFIYFFMVKAREYDLRRVITDRGTGSSVSELRTRARGSPSVENDLALADALEKGSRHEEASTLYASVLEAAPEDLRGVHGLARCRMGMGQFGEAIDLLDRVVRKDKAFGDYAAALDYAEALHCAGRTEDALDLARALADATGRLNHRLAHAHYAALAGDSEGARALVADALAEHETKPEDVRERQRRWVKRAEAMLADLARGDS